MRDRVKLCPADSAFEDAVAVGACRRQESRGVHCWFVAVCRASDTRECDHGEYEPPLHRLHESPPFRVAIVSTFQGAAFVGSQLERERDDAIPNQILHTFDSNLHTLLDELGGAARILKLKDSVRVQWHDHSIAPGAVKEL